jgi:hypothetical protein
MQYRLLTIIHKLICLKRSYFECIIRTMMKVFVSSAIRGFEQFREAAREAIIEAGMQPLMVEDPGLFPSQSLSPQEVCFQGVDDSDIFVLIIMHRYGDLTESGLSAVEEEYWRARLNEQEIRVFVHSTDREAEQEEFLTRISKWESGHFLNQFSCAEDLKSKMVQILSGLPESQSKKTTSPAREGIHDWLLCLKKYTEAQLDRSTMTTPIIGTEPRPEIDKLKSILLSSGKALIIGDSGTGKSGLLAMFVDGELLAKRQPVLFINANTLPRATTSLDTITRMMPIETPLAKILKLVSQIMGICYVVVDQIDSVGGTDLCRTLCGFLKEMSALPEIKVVVASRSYDAKERNEIRTLDFPTIEVGPLTNETTLDMLDKLSIQKPSPDLIILARNFLNLSLIGSLVEKGVLVSDLTSEVALWNRFRESIVGREGPEVLAKAVYFAQRSMKAQEWDFALDIAPDDSTKRLISRGILIPSVGDRYAFFHDEMRSYLYAWDASMRSKALPDTICKELGEVEAFGVLRWMHMMYHEEMPEVELAFVRLLMKPDSEFSFYTRAVCLDVLKKQHNPTPELAKTLCSSLRTSEAHSRYFFDQLDNPAWFLHLANQGIFDKTPEPIKTDKGMILPLWEVMEYLIRIANVYPDEIAEIAIRTKTENFRIYERFVKAAIQMPAQPAAKIARAALNWLVVPNPFLLVDHCGELTVHLAAGNEWSSAIALCEALTETTVDPVPERMKDNPYFLPNSRFKHDVYEVERFARDRIPALADVQFEDVMALLESRLVKTMSLDQREPNYSWWRDAVEDNHQSTGHWECKNILTDTIRDLLISWSKRDASRVTPILKKYAIHKNSIFRRIALYIIQINKQAYADLAKQLLTNRTLLYDIMIHHEYVNFLSNCFDLLASDQQEQLLTWITKGPKKKKDESKEKQKLTKNLWIRDRVYMLRENLPQDYVSLLESLTKQYGEPDHPDFLILHQFTSRWGSVSPLIQTQVEEMSDDELIEYLKTFRPSGRSIDGPTSEGLADTIKSAILIDPARFARIAPRFVDEKIISSYVYALLNGFQAAWKEGKDFEWEPVLNCCESLIVRPLNTKEDIGQDLFEEDPVKWAYIPGDIANLLEEGLRRDEHAIPPDYLPRVRELLVRLVEDPHPTLEEEKESLTIGNMSPAMLSLNCNRGKAMHALINYALRFVRIRKAEEGKDPFVDGRRIEPGVHQVLDDKLDKTKDPSLAVHSTFGWYLPYLFYLDRQWSEESLQLIFPSEQKTSEYWEAAWDAYVGYVGDFYTDLYRLLRPQYLRAIINMEQGTLTPSHERPYEKMAIHLMIAYINDLEKLEDSEGLLVQFYRHAPDRVRAHAVWFLWRSLQEQKPGKGNGLWLKIRHLWEIRLAVASEAQASYDMREELSSYAWLLKDTPENLDEIYALLEPIVPYLEVGTQDRHVVEYLAEQAKVFPTKASLLLLKMVREVPDSIYLSREEPVRQILETVNGSVEPGAKENVSKIVNLFGERGDYRYRDLVGRG